jgi:hypothetical protein
MTRERRLAGTGRQADRGIGDKVIGRQSTTCSGSVDFTLGTVDVLIDTLLVGRGRASTGTGADIDALLFSAGVIDANSSARRGALEDALDNLAAVRNLSP